MPEPPAPPSTATYRYLLHISCAAADEGFVERALLPGLGLLPGQSITRQDFTPGLPQAQEFERAVTQSRYTLLLISPAWREDPWTRYVEQVATLASLGQGRLLCLLRAAVPLSLDLQSRVNLDGSDADRLETALRRLRELLALPPPAPTPIPCPYPGMRPFSEGDAASFFGRERELEDLLLKLRSQRRVYLIGPSGSGKTSLLYAGLLPALQRPASPDDALLARVLRPGEQPLTALRRALREPQAGPDADDAAGLDDLLAALPADAPRLLLVLDQFEEVFTRAAAPARAAFFAGLHRLTREPRCAVLIVLRADFYPELMSSALWPEDGGEALAAARLELAPLRGERLREAIRRPAEQSGVFLEEGLLERLMADAAQEPGVLPLMQETLALLWERRKGRLLTVAAYQALSRDERSGLAVAVASKADGALAALADAGERAVARRVLLRLCHFGAGRSYTRRQQREDELQVAGEAPGAAQAERFQRVLQHLIDQRLLTVSGEPGGVRHVDLSHEVLLRGWPQLARWIDERRALEETRRRLEDKAEEWQRLEQRGGLLDAIEVAEAEAWLQGEAAQALGSSERLRALVTASRAALEQQLTLLREAHRRLVRLYQEQGRQELLRGRALRALVYLSEAYAQTPEPEPALRFLLAQAAAAADAQQAVLPHTASVLDAAFSPDGARVVTASEDQTARLWDARSGALLFTLAGHTKEVRTAAFSPDGARVVTASWDGTARIWDVHSGALLFTLADPAQGESMAVFSAAFSPDGRFVVTALGDALGGAGVTQLWDTQAGQLRSQQEGKSLTVSFSADGSRVVTADAGRGRVKIWDVHSGEVVHLLAGHDEFVYFSAFSPDGTVVITTDKVGKVKLWDAQRGALLFTLEGHKDTVRCAAFSPDGQRVMTASFDGTAQVWDVQRGVAALVLIGHEGTVSSAAFSPDGSRLLTAGSDGTARLWDARSGQPQCTCIGHQGAIRARFSPNGERLVSAGVDGSARLWTARGGPQRLALQAASIAGSVEARFSADGSQVFTIPAGLGGMPLQLWHAQSGQLLRTLEGGSTAALSPDGSCVVSCISFKADPPLSPRLLAVQSGQLRATLVGHAGQVDAVDFSADSARVLSISTDRTARLWDARTGQIQVVLRGHASALVTASFSPDGARVVTASEDGTAKLWDVGSGALLLTLADHAGPVSTVCFSPQGERVLTGDAEGKVRLWDVQSGQLLLAVSTHRRYLRTACFSRDGARVLTVGDGGPSPKLWDASSGRLLAELEGHRQGVRFATFSPNGLLISSADVDNVAMLWDGHSGRLLWELPGSTHQLSASAFSPDGAVLVTGGTDGVARLWDLPLETRAPAAITALTRLRAPYVLDEEGRLTPVRKASVT